MERKGRRLVFQKQESERLARNDVATCCKREVFDKMESSTDFLHLCRNFAPLFFAQLTEKLSDF